MNPVLVIANKSGWLANRLFVHGHALAFAATHGFTLLNPSLDEYAHYFQGTARDVWCRYPPARAARRPPPLWARRWLYAAVSVVSRVIRRGRLSNPAVRSLWLGDRGIDSEGLRHAIGSARLTFAEGGGLCAHKEWPAAASALREQFHPTEPWESGARALAGRARRDGCQLVGVHIRQGVAWEVRFEGRYSWQPSEYAALMRRTSDLLGGKAVFLVCSNGPFPREALADLPSTFGGEDPVLDLYALAACDLLIGTAPSTFLMWAAFWGEVPVYRVENPQAHFSLDAFRQLAAADIYPRPMPPDWVPSKGYRDFAERWGSRGPDQLWRPPR